MKRSLQLLLAASLTATATAQAPANDECTGAIAIGLGSTAIDTTLATQSATTWPCAGGGGPDIWFSYTSGVDALVTFSTCGSTYDTALEAFSGTCAALDSLACNDDACSVQSEICVPVAAGDTVYVRVGGWSGSTGTGTLDVSESPVQPQAGSTAAWLNAVAAGTPAIYTNSGLAGAIEDDIGTPGGASGVTYEFIVSGSNAGASSGLMGNLGSGVGASAGIKFEQWNNTMMYGITEFGVADHTFAGGTNTEKADVHLAFVTDSNTGTTELFENGISLGTAPYAPILQGIQGIGKIDRPAGADIDVFCGFVRGVAVYDGRLSAAEIQDHMNAYFSGSLGTPYCSPAVTNSTGNPAEISASGSLTVADNDITLTCTHAPTNAFGFFLTSRDQGLVMMPGGSQGNLCLGGAIGRYVGPGQVLNSGSAGEFVLVIDLTQHPTPTGLISVQPGDTWYFTTWFRDAVMGTATSNFSNGVCLTFI